MKFKGYLLTSLLSLAALSFPLVSHANEMPSTSYKDGVFEGSAKGYDSGITKVQVTVEGGIIKDVVVLSHGDTPMFFDMASATVIQNILAKNSPDVDTVTGASFSSYGIMNAVKDALGKGEQSNFVVHDWKQLQEAVSKAQDGDNIEIANDITDAGMVDSVASSTLTINKAITINGNQNTITPAAGATYAFYILGTDGAKIQDLKIKDAYYDKKHGGGLYVKGSAHLTLDRVHFINNTAGRASDRNAGGAVFADNHGRGTPTVIINDCRFENNKVMGIDGKPGKGGAVAAFNANVSINNSYFANNQGGYGGAIVAYGNETNLSVTNSTFESDNQATLGGDDIYIFDGYTWLRNKTQLDSNVNVSLENNTYLGADGSDFKDYRVVRGRLLGSITEDPYNDITTFTKENHTGASTFFKAGHDIIFPKSETTRSQLGLDLSPLYQAYEQGKAITNDNYTQESWNHLTTALSEAESYLMQPTDSTLAVEKEKNILMAIEALRKNPTYTFVAATLDTHAQLMNTHLVVTHTKATYQFKVDAPSEEITSITLNNQSLSPADYSIDTEANINLTSDKVASLTPGEYQLTVQFQNGQKATLDFKLMEENVMPIIEETKDHNTKGATKTEEKSENTSSKETTKKNKDGKKDKKDKKNKKSKAPKTGDQSILVMGSLLGLSLSALSLKKKNKQNL